jgi:hypothetical protein
MKRMDPYLDKESWRYLEQANRIGIEFLLADLNVGLTFLETAQVTSLAATRTRDLDKALQVYRTVMRHLPRVVLPPDDEAEIASKLEELRSRLEEAGYSFKT